MHFGGHLRDDGKDREQLDILPCRIHIPRLTHKFDFSGWIYNEFLVSVPTGLVHCETGLYAFLNLDNELFLEQDVLLVVIAWVHKALDE